MLDNLFLSSYLEAHISKGKSLITHSSKITFSLENIKQGNFDFSCMLLSTKMYLREIPFDYI